MIKDKFIFYNTEFSFNFMPISKVFRINANKLDKLVDFDNRIVIKLTKHKGHLKFCSMSNKIKVEYTEVVTHLKSNYEFMNQLMRFIDLMAKNYHPKSLDYSSLTGNKNDVIINESPLSNNDVVVKWFNDFDTDNSKLLITIF